MATFRTQKSGKIRAEVFVQGQRRSRVFENKTKAKNWAVEMESQLAKTGDGVSQTHTLIDLFRRYSDEISTGKKGARWETIRLKKFEEYPLAKMKLRDLRREDFEVWVDFRKKTVKASTVNRELNLLSNCLTQARRWRLMESNPMTDLKRPRNPPHRDRRISLAEVNTILAAFGYVEDMPIETRLQRAAVAFLLALETAMRAGEICSIRPSDYDEVSRVVTLVDTKNGHGRKVPLSTRAVELINKLRPFEEGKPIFKMRSGDLSTAFYSVVQLTDIQDLTFHDTRHEATTRLAKKFHVLDLARITGHRDIKQLQTYYNPTAEELAQQLA